MNRTLEWTDEQYRQFGTRAMVSPHPYHELDLFTDATLARLLDEYPRRNLQAYTMGEDPTDNTQWKQVDVPEGLSGERMLEAVRHGRIWINLTRIEQIRPEYYELIQHMYAQIGEKCPHLSNPRPTHSALLISSPRAQVYYHMDAEPNMLWHLRGHKKVWIYPAMDFNLAPQNYIEDIYAGEIGENLPYKPEFDAQAVVVDLKPGDAASWPHNGPHRIVNDDMNVSLATSYITDDIYKRQYVILANRFLLRNAGIAKRSIAEDGLVPAAKRFAYRAINKVRPFKRRNRTASYVTTLQLDPDQPIGYRVLDEPRLASFADPALKAEFEARKQAATATH